MVIYTASKTKHADKWIDLRAKGYPINSTWIDEAGPGETIDHNDLWKRCLQESADAEVMILYREPGDELKGAWVELGVALTNDTKVFAVGIEEYTIGKSNLVEHCPTLSDAIERTREYLANLEPDYKEILMRLIAGSACWDHTGDAEEAMMRACVLANFKTEECFEFDESKIGRDLEKANGEQKSIWEDL